MDMRSELVVEVDLGRFFQLGLNLVQLCLAHHLLDAAVKLARQGARPANPIPGDSQRRRQILRADHDQRDDADQHEFGPADIKEHRVVPGACGRPNKG